jgi:hypothetical protein
MAEDPGSLQQQMPGAEDLPYRLEIYERAPSEHAKAVVLNEKWVPWIRKKGRPPKLISAAQGLLQHISLLFLPCSALDTG